MEPSLTHLLPLTFSLSPSLSPSRLLQERFDECRDKLSPFLKGCGYNLKKDVVFLPISAYTAQNVIKPVGDAAPW